MKKLFFSPKKFLWIISLFAFLFLIALPVFSQLPPPEGINYQAVARDTAGKPISNSVDLVVRFTIWPDNTGTGASVFTETHSPVNTNRYGLFTLVIGSVNTTDFQNIFWVLGDKFLEVEIATVGGSSYISMGKTQMMSVPYSLHSKTALYALTSWHLAGDSINSTDFIGTTNPEDLVLKTNNTEKMRLQSGGNIGIGTATPLSLLDVSGGIAIGATYSGTTAAPANGAIIEGNVGIGTSSPDAAAMLDVAGQIKITGGSPGMDKVLTSDAAGLAAWAIPDTGTVLSFSADSLLPLFTTTVTTPTTTPALSFTLSDAASYTLFGNNTGVSTTPTYFLPSLASSLFQNQGTSTTVLHGNAAGNPSWSPIVSADITDGTIVNIDILNVDAGKITTGILPIARGGTNTGIIGLAGTIPYSNATSYGFSAVGTSGQVLTSAGSGTPTWTTPTVGTVTSVTGITPIFSTGGANPAISVATNSQASPGVVAAGGSNTDKVWKTDASGVPSWRTDSSGTYTAGTGLSLSGTTFNSVWTQSGNNIYNNNTDSVGIGTTSPTAKLHVKSITTGSTGIFETVNASNSSAAFVAKTNGSGSAIFALNSGTWNAINGTSTGTQGKAGEFQISNAANFSDALYAATIGTGKAGNFQISNSGSSADALYISTNGTSSKVLNVSHTGATAGSTNYGVFVSNTGAGTGATNIAAYFTASGAATNYAGIFAAGNVGIGLTAPASLLHAAGQIRTGIPSGGLGGASATTGSLLFYNALNSNTVNITSNTTSTSYTLTLPAAQGAASSVLTNNGAGILSWAAGALPAWSLTGNTATTPSTSAIGTAIGAGQHYIGTTDAQDFVVGTTNLERLRITSGGNVGIGTKTPASNLHVYKSVAAAADVQNILTLSRIPTGGVNAVAGEGMGINFQSTNNGSLTDITRITSILTAQGTNPYSAITFSSLNNVNTLAEVMRIQGGNVGIGTVTPATNARLAIKDGHLQSQQTTAPTVAAVTNFVLASQSLSNATDVAGNISIVPVAALSGSVAINFNKSYSVAPIVILTPTNGNSANDIAKVWVSSTTTGFTVNFTATFDTSAHTFSYHVIETQ